MHKRWKAIHRFLWRGMSFREHICLWLLVAFIAFCSVGCMSDPGVWESSPPDVSATENTDAEESPTITDTPESEAAPEPEAETEPEISSIMNVMVFNAGKADAILITTDNSAVLIDTGEAQHGDQITDYLLNCGITEIDYLIITHFHKDHVGGADTIIKNLTVKDVIVPNYGKQSKQYEQFAAAMEEAGLESGVLTETIEFTLDGVNFTVYPSWQEYYYFGDSSADDDTDEDDYEDTDETSEENVPKENNFSLAVSVNHGNNNFLFAGDAKAKRLKELLLTGGIVNTQYDFLKVPHHGRYNKRSEDFIYAIAPQYAVITCSLDYPADERVVAALEEVGAEVFFTTNGNVSCESDGERLTMMYR